MKNKLPQTFFDSFKIAFFIMLSFVFPALSEPHSIPASQSLSEPPHLSELRNGVSIYDEPKYASDFTHFDYVNPEAPKGGSLKMAVLGTFDSLNPFIIKGIPASGLMTTFDTLLTSSSDEPFAEYALIAESFYIPKDRKSITFYLNKEAKFHNDSPILAEDVIFSFETFKKQGSPAYRYYYNDVKSVEKINNHTVKFIFKHSDNRELPLIMGQLPIISKADWTRRDFSATTLEPILGSGPYSIKSFEQGRYITYERVKNYWAKDLPTRKGMFNFDIVSYDYYMDTTSAMQGLKSKDYDLRIENEAKQWENGYDFKHNGDFIKKEFANGLPSGVQGFVFNTRRDVFKDRKVREALNYAFDFEWTNKALFYNHYKRIRSYFDNSDMAAEWLPSEEELKLLEPYKTEQYTTYLPERVFNKEYIPAKSDGSGYIRDNLTTALELLDEAGWKLDRQGILRNQLGEAFKFEILLNAESSSAWERISIPFVKNLSKLGITANIRKIDTTQYQNRLNNFDYDMISLIWGQSLSPGAEQRYFWGSKAADSQGSRNYAGIKNPVIDNLIKDLINARTYKELTTATKALDRVLQWNFYIIPHWYLGKNRIAYWDKFAMPSKTPLQGVNIFTWWEKKLQ